MSYHSFKTRAGTTYGSFEVFMVEKGSMMWQSHLEEGWYWWACFPGCMPEGDIIGPFKTEKEAIDNAQESEE